ncbi:MAG: cupin domain-containing protein [Chloroflexi bacterium]|nr:cupin domain-containing protein [Chloroflexota bacterium]
MAKVGDTIEHPVTGERLTFLETASSSDGAVLKMAFEMRPHAVVPGIHAHPRQEERFGLVSGRIRIKTAKREWIAQAGEDIVIPRGAGHTWGNPFEEPAHVVVELRPALRAETYFETYFGLARDGRVNPKNGLPSLLQLALMLHEYRKEFTFPPPFGALGVVAAAVLSPLARARGYRARYGRYEDPNGP